MSDFKIVGIMLVKNEDMFIEQSIRNVIDFCDHLIITDHQSTDRTFEICERLAIEFKKIDLRRIQHAVESAQVIMPYYNTNTWIFAVDGDEIYDPVGLQNMKKKLMNGAFAGTWCIFGNVLNAVKIDPVKKTATGHLAPPSRPITKLYNFSIIEDWQGLTTERLHGGNIIFKPGFHEGLRCYLYRELTWEEAYFRCLHVAYMQRSSKDTIRLFETRLNLDELHQIDSVPGRLLRLYTSFRMRLRQMLGRDWKTRKYRRGELVTKDVKQFFP